MDYKYVIDSMDECENCIQVAKGSEAWDTIRLALRIAQAVSEEPSEGMIKASMTAWQSPRHPEENARMEFRAMIEQMMREIENE